MLPPLVQDLLANAGDRLQKWLDDTIMRCEAVDLDDKETYYILMTTLVYELMRSIVGAGMKREDALILLQRTFDTVQRDFNEFKKKSHKVG